MTFPVSADVRKYSDKTMSRHNSWIVMLIVVVILHGSDVATSTNQNRMKRSEINTTCFDSASKCRSNSTCQIALKSVRKKCSITSGKCDAEVKDLTKCADDIQTLRDGFTGNEQCSCLGHQLSGNKLRKCLEIYNLVYFNPCFENGEAARRQTNQPESDNDQHNDDAYYEVTTSSGTVTSISDVSDDVEEEVVSNENATEAKINESDLEKIDEILFDDDVKPRKKKPVVHKEYHNDVTIKTKITTTKLMTTRYDVTTFTDISSTSQPLVHQLPQIGKNLKIFLIVLGTIIFICFVVGISCFFRRRSGYSAGKSFKKTSLLITFNKDKTQRPTPTS